MISAIVVLGRAKDSFVIVGLQPTGSISCSDGQGLRRRLAEPAPEFQDGCVSPTERADGVDGALAKADLGRDDLLVADLSLEAEQAGEKLELHGA